MRRTILDDYRFQYLNDLFDMKLIFLQVVFNNFLLIDTTDRSKISSDQKRFFFAVPRSPFIFRKHSL